MRSWTDLDIVRQTLYVRGTLLRIDGELVLIDPKTRERLRALR